MSTPDNMVSKSRLLVFHPALAPYRLDFFNALADRFECRVVFLQRTNPDLFLSQEELLREARFDYTFLDRHIKIKGRDVNRGYWREIRKFRPDIVLCSEFNLSTLAVWAYRLLHRRKFSLFTMCDDSMLMAEKCEGGRRSRRNFMVKRLDGVVNVSEETARWYAVHTPAQRTISFPIVRDEARFEQQHTKPAPQAAEYIARLNLAYRRTALFVGRFVEVKNLPALLRVFARFVKKDVGRQDCRLILVGSGEQQSELEQIIAENGLKEWVLLPGAFTGDSLMAWYDTAAFFVLPSTYEAFGAVVGEALLCGCKVLVSEKAGARELVGESNGCTFDPADEDAFEHQLTAMFENAPHTPPAGFERSHLMPVSFGERMDALESFLLAGNKN